jgi:uncharacterized protein (TIGR02996 family)
MSLDKAFLADIVEHPDDDAPRLVYADWLEDNGDPQRAEFIRTQCELARPRMPGGPARRRELQKREKSLFADHGERWTEATGKWYTAHLRCWNRGFPHIASVGGSTLSSVAAVLPHLFATAPVTDLIIDNLNQINPADGEKFASRRALSRLRRLHFSSGVFSGLLREQSAVCEQELAALFRSPHLANLEQLELIQIAVGEQGLQSILTLPRLHAVEFYSTNVPRGTARRICRSPLASRLTELRLSDDHGPAAVKAIAETPALVNLRVLDLNQTGINDQSAIRLAVSAHLAGLRELVLYYGDIGDAGAAALANSPHLGKLRLLDLGRNQIGTPGVRSLINSTTLPRGLHLDLWDNHLYDYTPEIRAELRQRFRKVNFARSK